MPAHSKLATLLSLVDDDSPVVQQEVAQALAGFEDLRGELGKIVPAPSLLQRISLQRIMGNCGQSERRLLRRWSDWFDQTEDLQRLETALGLVADFQTEYLHPEALPQVLDRLSGEYRHLHPQPDPRSLSDYLFAGGRLAGARENYVDPFNSNLVDVVETGTGIPISLVAIYILVGRRVGLAVEGCDYPGHFLARVRLQGRYHFVDCFEGGLWMGASLRPELRGRVPLHNMTEVLTARTSAEEVVARVLRNLIHAHQHHEDQGTANLFRFLLKVLDSESPGSMPAKPGFEPGDLVRHKEHPFRGVVVDYDLQFEPGATGFRARPEECHQPWYQVLVDRTRMVSYTAESQLRADDSCDEVHHPYVSYFFQRFDGGRYLRNNLPWPRS